MSTATLEMSEARREFARLPERLREQQVIWITRHNKRAFAIVDMELMETVLETLEILRDPDALKMLQNSLVDIQEGRLIDHDDLEASINNLGGNCEHPCSSSVDGNGPGTPAKSAKRDRQGDTRKSRATQVN
ncbi:MAG: type II toxin-antitoxin system prevent-host-death family antitoxin [Patescibacteria group bacterium]|nr:type II toxin-antitoxin system prevent-host-death family antitoxin [Patescibacteria group bacterium]